MSLLRQSDEVCVNLIVSSLHQWEPRECVNVFTCTDQWEGSGVGCRPAPLTGTKGEEGGRWGSRKVRGSEPPTPLVSQEEVVKVPGLPAAAAALLFSFHLSK